jgi:protein-S-isoprenylcysteine O-methyltransferase Ste14
MNTILQIGLPIYFTVYFSSVFLLKTILIGKRIGKSPLVLPKNDTAYAVIGTYFKYTIIGVFLYILLFSIFPRLYGNFLPIGFLEINFLKTIGIVLLILSLIWTVIAQNNMKNSWRIGIDTETKTELIKNGLFKVSRNPIFLGLITTLIGLFLTTPNAVTLILLILCIVLIQIQTRLEEEFLIKQHGVTYKNYQKETRRFI